MINGDQTLDMLPYVVDIYEKLNLQEQAKKIVEKKKDITQKELGTELFKYALKNTKLIKSELFAICGIIEGKSEKEIRKRNIVTTIIIIVKEFKGSDYKELLGFFEQAM